MWEYFVEEAIQCVLYRSPTGRYPLLFFRKFSVLEDDNKTYKYRVAALFPLVEEVYCNFFWNQLSAYIDENEASLWDIRREAPPDMRERLFEQLVFSRLARRRLSIDDVKRLLEDANLAQEIDVTGRLHEKDILA